MVALAPFSHTESYDIMEEAMAARAKMVMMAELETSSELLRMLNESQEAEKDILVLLKFKMQLWNNCIGNVNCLLATLKLHEQM